MAKRFYFYCYWLSQMKPFLGDPCDGPHKTKIVIRPWCDVIFIMWVWRGMVSVWCSVKMVWYDWYGYSWSFSVQCQLGVIRCTCLTTVCNLKAVGCRANRNDIWDSGILVERIYGVPWTFYCLRQFRGLFGAFVSIPATRKRPPQGETGWHVGLVDHIWGTFDLKVFKVILLLFGALLSKWTPTWNSP